MRTVYLLSFLLLLTSAAQPQSLDLPFSRYYSSQEYQGGIQNYAITQHASGLLYIANNYGLLVHDGTTWRRYSLPNSSKVRHVQVSENGTIYVSGQGEFGTFTAADNGELRYQSLKDSLPENFQNLEEVWKVFLGNENIYFCTSDRVFAFDQSLRLSSAHESQSGFESFHFVNKTLFVNERGTGLKKLDNGSFSLVSPEFSDRLVTGLLPTGANKYLIFTRDDGIYELTGGSLKPWMEMPELSINAVLRLSNGQIAIATQLSGLVLTDMEGRQLMHMDKDNGLNNNSIVSLFEDLSGNLWLGHNNGLSMLQLSYPFGKINQYSGLTGTGYHAIVEQESMYLATNNGVFAQQRRADGSSHMELIPNTNGQVYQIKSIMGRLMVAHNDGAFVIKSNRAEKISGPEGIWNFQRLKNHPEIVLAGSYEGLHLYKLTEEGVSYISKLAGFEESGRIIEQDDKGNIWVAHGYKGLYKLRPDSTLTAVSVRYYGIQEGLPSNIFNNVWKVNNRLIFTTQAGAFRYNELQDRFERDSFFDLYFATDFLIHYLLEDQMGNIFFIGETEMGVLEKKVDGSYQKHYQIFNPLMPLLNDDLPNIASLRGNEVVFAANEGFIRFNLNENTFQPPVFPTLIRAAYLTGTADSLIFGGNRHHSSSDPPEIPYKRANIRFESSNASPNNENELSYQYWLEGFEEDYGEWTDKPEKAYTNLREGSYVFHSKSRNIYGAISPEASFAFKVLPPWYRNKLAYLTYAMLLLSGLLLAYRIVEKRYQKKTLQIRTASRVAIEAKESELKTSQREIEKLRMEKLKQAIQLKNKELASATMHLITKNGFIDHVRNNLNAITKKSRNQEVKQEIQKVIKTIEKNMAGDKDWEQFEIHFDQVHGDFMGRFKKEFGNLSPQEIKLSAYLRMNLSTKEIAYLMNISVRGVEIARYRLRKKLDLERSDNLQEFILKY
ncbi:Y_Y_Y domain-containing protein [Cyclobacterium lianum]|uniref:Y_Y_Y domain-containing protein n=1 Tax=Cyclobacterium lianum TaxID=388280 RepID=A0A1M7PSU9_9BACT|nr:regulator [Cyclobacterium lianum]SHN20529.1 Y_Y_Y domain-containing protein [Cyclobacterium lianum]